MVLSLSVSLSPKSCYIASKVLQYGHGVYILLEIYVCMIYELRLHMSLSVLLVWAGNRKWMQVDGDGDGYETTKFV